MSCRIRRGCTATRIAGRRADRSRRPLGALLLLPVALLVQAGYGTVGIRVYALVFAVAGCAGIAELVFLRRLTHPGRVRVAAREIGRAHV